MARTQWRREDFWPELEEAGETVVRDRILAGVYTHTKKALAEEYLAQMERERKEASNREQMRIARSAKNAAWAAAIAAIIAAICAIVAISISVSSF